MKNRSKENILAVVVICMSFVVTLGLCFLLDGSGVIGAVFKKNSGGSVYAIAVGGYEDMTLARTTSELIKQRGGAGYVRQNDGTIEIYYAVYPTKEEANSVLSMLSDASAYIVELKLQAVPKWASKDKAASKALGYYDLAFDALYDISNSLNGKDMTLQDAKNSLDVLKDRLLDLKDEFYKSADGDAKSTEIKIALITAVALIENISVNESEAKSASSCRYQLVQLVLSRQALLEKL